MIIGNGAAGTHAAEQLRKHDAAAEIVMIDDEKHTLYNRVSLPRYLKASSSSSASTYVRNTRKDGQGVVATVEIRR